MNFYVTESDTTTISTSVTIKGKAQGTLLFEGGMLSCNTSFLNMTSAKISTKGI